MWLRNLWHELDQTSRRVLVGVIVGAALLSSAPYVLGWVFAGTQHTYLAMNPIAPADTNVYFSFIEQARQGNVLLRNLHTGEPQNGSLFHPLWLVLGWLAGVFRLSVPVVFHLARVALGAIFLFVVYHTLMRVCTSPRQRNLAFVLIAFSSGIGAFLPLSMTPHSDQEILLLWSTDQWVSESNTFLTLFHSPLFVLSQLLLLIVWGLFLAKPGRGATIFTGAVVFLAGLMHPYDLVTIGAVLVAFLLMRILRDPRFLPADAKQYARRLLVAGLFALPVVAYFLLISATEPAIGEWARRNVTTSPLPHNYLFGYGLLWVFAVVGFMAWRRTQKPERLFVLTWVVTSIILLYLPFQINRRMSNGLHLPLALLAAVELDLLWTALQRAKIRPLARQLLIAALGWVCVLGLFFSTIVTIVRAVYLASNPQLPLYDVPRDDAVAMRWIKEHSSSQDVLLSDAYHGNLLPAYTGRAVYAGHGHQTLRWEEKLKRINTWFFATNKDDAAKQRFLRNERITVVYITDATKKLGSFRAEEKPYLRLMYRNDAAAVYRVIPE